MSHNEWRVIRRQPDGTYATIGHYLDPDKAAQKVQASKDVLPNSKVSVQVRRVTVHHGEWEEVA